MNKVVSHAIPFIGAALFCGNVTAHEAGDFILRAGLTTVSPDADSSTVTVNTVGDIGMSIDVDNGSALGLNFVYMLNNTWGIEVLAATPFSHDISLNNTSDNELGLGDGALAKTKQLPPTVSALYFFNGNSSLAPYIGIGLNYTIFFEDDFVSARTEQSFTNLKLDNSVGLGVQVGFDYSIDDNWLINASIRYIDIETKASFQVLDLESSVSATLDPWVYSVMLGYKF